MRYFALLLIMLNLILPELISAENSAAINPDGETGDSLLDSLLIKEFSNYPPVYPLDDAIDSLCKIDHYPLIEDWFIINDSIEPYCEITEVIENKSGQDYYITSAGINTDTESIVILSNIFTINDSLMICDVKNSGDNAFVGLDIGPDGKMDYWKKNPGIWLINTWDEAGKDAIMVMLADKDTSQIVEISGIKKRPIHPIFQLVIIIGWYFLIPAALISGMVYLVRRKWKKEDES